jgi:hypothetical protein
VHAEHTLSLSYILSPKSVVVRKLLIAYPISPFTVKVRHPPNVAHVTEGGNPSPSLGSN